MGVSGNGDCGYSLVRFFLILSFGLLAGCAGDAGGLTLTSLRSERKFTQNFSKAFVARNANGDLDIVLLDDAAAKAFDGGSADGRVRQIMHIRVLWTPGRDLKINDPVTSNASIHWYVLAPAGTMEYRGTGFVSTQGFSDLLRVSVSDADMKPVSSVAGMRDPVGPARISGAVFAKPDGKAVHRILGEVRSATAATTDRHTR